MFVFIVCYYMFTILDYSSALEYSIIRRYTNIVYYYINKNIIPHKWKLANIVPIPKPNKDTDRGTSYRPISLFSVIAKTLEKSLIRYITANIPNTPMQYGVQNTTLYSDGSTHTK